MSRARDLENRLLEWGKEYGGGRYQELGGGGSWLASLMRWHGRAPSGLGEHAGSTGADEVQDAVLMLLSQPKGIEPAEVLRIEYLEPGKPREAKLRRLRMSSVRYSQHLRIAKIHVASWLRIPFDDPISNHGRDAVGDFDMRCGIGVD